MKQSCQHIHDAPRAAMLMSLSLVLTIGAVACGDDIMWPTTEELPGAHLMSSTFGPREQGSASNRRYDFHRGLDIPAPYGSPARAMLAGTVRVAGDDSDYGDDTILIVHCLDKDPPADLIENPDDCGELYYTMYSHLSDILVTSGERVGVGEVIGETGAGGTGLEHLHAEFRKGDRHKANAIHPLLMLPYNNLGPPELTIDQVDASDPDAIEVVVTVTVPASQLDVNRVEVELYALGSGLVFARQHYDYVEWNQLYSSSDLDNHRFNGVVVEPEAFTRTSAEKVVHFHFRELASSLHPSRYRVIARAIDIEGQVAEVTW